MSKIAIIGSGISGLTAAYLLNQQHEITLFEANDRLGGHTATKTVDVNGQSYDIDTGFIVFNDWTYPNFIRLLKELGVQSKPTSMGFSVSNEITGLEYSGQGLNTFFAQRRNLFSVRHWAMLRDILRFNKEAIADLELGNLDETMSLGTYLKENRYSAGFIDDYLIPMGAAIWSATEKAMREFPLVFFVRFFKNHGLLSVKNRPQWHVIDGGSKQYIEPLVASYSDKIRLNSAVVSITRSEENVSVELSTGEKALFDEVVIAAHSDQALSMLADATNEEQGLLSGIPYQNNDVVLHTDERFLPKRRQTWSSWNYRIKQESELPVLTYSMNILQGISSQTQFCVTLNDTQRIDPEKILGSYQYAHPVFGFESMKTQAQWSTINGRQRTWFCGAYWGNGFHEDGVNSAIKVASGLGVEF